MITGGYSSMHPVSGEEMEIFRKALNGLVGVAYEPLIVATQVVAGTNYCFICNATMMDRAQTTFVAKVTIHCPLPGHGEPMVVDITKI